MPELILDYSRLGQDRLKPFLQTDIRIDKKWNFNKWTLDIFIEVQNAFNSNLPAPPTIDYVRDDEGNVQQPVSLAALQGLNNSSILPTLGIVIDF